MLFTSPLYGVFLVGTWAVFWLLGARRRVARPLFLVAASYGFYYYGTWDAARDEAVPLAAPWWALMCLAVIFLGSTIDFYIGRALARIERRAARNALLGLSIGYYLGVLAFFKYWNFAADSIASAAALLGAHLHVTRLRLVLPFGISFFTFETMSYTIDVWRRELQPAKRYLDYLLFVSFFPHLVAGPIVRPPQMLPQLAAAPRADAAMQGRGLWRIATGLAKKIVIGDFLAQAIVNRVFEAPERFTALEVLVAVYAYAFQIYTDFSGYSDVAVGSAALFGYVLPENFDAPYRSGDLQEFWRRWHISLSTWLRDYLYKPLGGSRGGSFKTYRNLMITMVLGGLWHGASWNFVLWGALHGGALGVTRVWQRARALPRALARAARASATSGMGGVSNTGVATGSGGAGPAGPTSAGEASAMAGGGAMSAVTGAGGGAHVLATIATFHFVCFAWIFFRAPTFEHAALTLHQLVRGGWRIEHVAPKVPLVVAVAALLHLVPRAWERRLREAFVRTPALVQGLVLAAVAVALHLVAGAKPEPFVYGQF